MTRYPPGGVSQPPDCRPPAVRQRAEPVAVGPAQGLRQQPPRAPCLPPRRLPRGQVELLSPEGEDRYWGGHPGPPRGCWQGVSSPRRRREPAVPQGWGATGPGTASPCRTGVTPWTPRRRRSASSTTFRGSEGPSGEPPPRGDPPAPPPSSCQQPVPLLLLSLGKSTGSCWSQRVPQMAPGMKVGLGGGFGILGTPLGMLWLGLVPSGWGRVAVVVGGRPPWGCGVSLLPPPPAPCRHPPARGAEPALRGAGGPGGLSPPGAAPGPPHPRPAAAADVRGPVQTPPPAPGGWGSP